MEGGGEGETSGNGDATDTAGADADYVADLTAAHGK